MNQNKTYFNNNLIKLCSCYYKFTLYTFVYLLVFFNNMLPDLQVNQVLILGDFNSCELSEYLPALQRYLDCPTRLNQTIDRCNGK